MDVKTYRSAGDGSTTVAVRIDDNSMAYAMRATLDEAIRLAAKAIADEVVEKLGPQIIERISADAIANMAIAEAGAAVNRTLKEKLPDKIIEVERRGERETVILQRGMFGGLKRI